MQIWNTETLKKIRTYDNHTGRVGALSWSLSSSFGPGAPFQSTGNSSATLTSGSRDHSIVHRDLRAPEASYHRLTGHRQEICGLKWNFEGTQLASGGNDNKLLVWDAAWMGNGGRGAGRNSRTSTTEGEQPQPLWKFHEHQAAVKAIAWSPHTNGLLVSGGGTQDKTIRTWNTSNGKLVNWLDTGSQVCTATDRPETMVADASVVLRSAISLGRRPLMRLFPPMVTRRPRRSIR